MLGAEGQALVEAPAASPLSCRLEAGIPPRRVGGRMRWVVDPLRQERWVADPLRQERWVADPLRQERRVAGESLRREWLVAVKPLPLEHQILEERLVGMAVVRRAHLPLGRAGRCGCGAAVGHIRSPPPSKYFFGRTNFVHSASVACDNSRVCEALRNTLLWRLSRCLQHRKVKPNQLQEHTVTECFCAGHHGAS